MERVGAFKASVQAEATQLWYEVKSRQLPLKKALLLLSIVTLLALIFLIAGICCISKSITIPGTPGEVICKNITIYDYEFVTSQEYTERCLNANDYKCRDIPGDCSCVVDIELPKSINGDVVLGYHLDTFNKPKEFYQSRDDNQLSGKLSRNVSALCRPPFDYLNSTPIAPCGELANAMFTDKVLEIHNNTDPNNTTQVPQITYGLLREEEKQGFRNPEHENLTVAFQNFAKPLSWTKNIWELDLNLRENNGFQNEAFIVWMRNDLKVKPLWRLNRTGEYKNGLQKGSYAVNIQYNYPKEMYDGPRTLSFYKEIKTEEPLCHNTTGTADSESFPDRGLGIAFIVLSSITIFICGGFIIALKTGKITWGVQKSDKVVDDNTNGRPTHKPPEPPSETLSSDKRMSHPVSDDGDSESQLLEKRASTLPLEPEKKPLDSLIEGDN